jgi:hypothetical protein
MGRDCSLFGGARSRPRDQVGLQVARNALRSRVHASRLRLLSRRPAPMTPEEIVQTLRAAGVSVPEAEIETLEDGVAILLSFIARLDPAPAESDER